MRRTFPILCLLIVTLPTFSRLPTHEFVLTDDRGNIFENPHFERDSKSGISWFWKHAYFKLYIPVTYTAWGLLARLAYAAGWSEGLSDLVAGPFHVANLVAHLGAAAMVYLLLLKLFPPRKNRWAAMFGALVFAVHPVQVEPVAWATGLKDVFSGFLGLAAVLLFLYSIEKRRTPGARFGFGLAALILFAAAILAKPSAVVAILFAGILARYVMKIDWWRLAPGLITWAVIAVVVISVNRFAQPAGEAALTPALWMRPFIAADALWFYLGKLVYPLRLAPMYERGIESFVQGFGFVKALLLAVPFAGVYMFLQRWRHPLRRILAIGLGLWVAGFLPVLGLIPFEFQTLSTVADRYNYLPLFGVAFLVCGFLNRWNRRGVYVAAGAVVTVLAAMSHAQVAHWRDARSFIEMAIAHRPESAYLLRQRGILLTREKRFPEAIEAFEGALRLDSKDAESVFNIGIVHARQNRMAEAVPHFRRAVELAPDEPEYRLRLGMSLLAEGKREEAKIHLSMAGPEGRALLERLPE